MSPELWIFLGDTNYDCVVDILDLIILGNAFGSISNNKLLYLKELVVKGGGSTSLKVLDQRRIISVLFIYLAVSPSLILSLSLVEGSSETPSTGKVDVNSSSCSAPLDKIPAQEITPLATEYVYTYSCGGCQWMGGGSCYDGTPICEAYGSNPPACPSGYTNEGVYFTRYWSIDPINEQSCNCGGGYGNPQYERICSRETSPCPNPDYPNYCGGNCWSNCYPTYGYGGWCCNGKWYCCPSTGLTVCCPSSGDAQYCCNDATQWCDTSGNCHDYCSNECTSGSRRCVGDAAEECGDWDGDGCTEWGNGMSCAYGCSNGYCNECVFDTWRCSGDWLQRCVWDGTKYAWQNEMDCASQGDVGWCEGPPYACYSCNNECDWSGWNCQGNNCCFCDDVDSDGCWELDCSRPQSECCSYGYSCQSGSCKLACTDECSILEQHHWVCNIFTSEHYYCDECDTDVCLDKCLGESCAYGCTCNGLDCDCVTPECYTDADCGAIYGLPYCDIDGKAVSYLCNIDSYACEEHIEQCEYGCLNGYCEPPAACTYDGQTYSHDTRICDKNSGNIWKCYDGGWFTDLVCDYGCFGGTNPSCYSSPTCNNYCDGDILYYNGQWTGTECTWSNRVCTYDCFNNDCVEPTAFPFKLSIENDVPGVVYKQPGDFVSLIVSSNNAQKINLNFDSELNYVSGPLIGGQVDARDGDVIIKFRISEDANPKIYIIDGYNSQMTDTVSFEVITNPKIIIITDEDALKQRFNQNEGTNAILQQALTLANSKRGVLYDLTDYKSILGNRPWNNFSEYNEKPVASYCANNVYSNNLARFIQKKCTDCENVMIVGDDFVVPYYRVDYKIFTGWEIPIMHEWIFNNPETKNLYSDANYIPRDVKTIAEIDSIFKHAEENQQKTRPFEWDGEQIIYVVPDDYNISKLTSLNNTIKAYYPAIKEKNYRVYKSSQIACNEYGKLQENTLILIGDRTNNEAIKCVPWFDVGNEEKDKFNASLMLERNVWGGDTYSIIISGDTERGIKLLELLISSPELYNFALLQQTQVVYIYDFSSPPEYVSMDDYIYGYVFNDCEHVSSKEELGCYIIGTASYFVPYVGWAAVGRDVYNYCLTVDKDGTDWFICVSSAATLGWKALPNEVKGSIAKTITDSRAFGAFTKVYSKTKEKLGSATKFLEKLGVTTKDKLYNFLEITDDGQVMEAVNEYTMILNEYDDGLREVLVLTEEGGDDILVQTVRNMDDVKNLGAGAERLMKSSDISIKGLGQTLGMTDDELGRFIQSVGYSENKFKLSEETLRKLNIKISSNQKHIVITEFVPGEDGEVSKIIISISDRADIDTLINGRGIIHEFFHIKLFDKYGNLLNILNEPFRIYEETYYDSFEEVFTHYINYKFSGDSSTVKNFIQSETYPINYRIDADKVVTDLLNEGKIHEIVEFKAASRLLDLDYENFVDQILIEKNLSPEQINAINELTNSFVTNAKELFKNNELVPKADYSNILNGMGSLIDNLASLFNG